MKSNATGGLGGGTSGGEGGGLDAPVRPIPKRSFSPAPPAVGDDVQSPAPEKPYQGVGRLIDEWQRKTAADAGDAPRSPVSRRKGGGGAGTGATASPRRAGVIAGRGAQD
jgi:AP2-associated kinase